MSVISLPNTFSPNTTISSSEVNSNFSTIYNEFNGSISSANLANEAVTTAKIDDDAVTTAKILDSNVTTAKLASAVGKIIVNVPAVDVLAPPKSKIHTEGLPAAVSL